MSLRLIRCPVCRARLAGDEPLEAPCRRCGADLRWVRAAERGAERACGRARAALEEGDSVRAVREARLAVSLVDEPSTRDLLEAARSAQIRGRRSPPLGSSRSG